MNALNESNFLYSIIVAGSLGFLPFLTVVTTSFAKIAIVLLIVRNALGIQQMPPNILMYSMALILTVFIMAPAFADIYGALADPRAQLRNLSDWEKLGSQVAMPIRDFLDKFTDPTQKAFFTETTKKIWAGKFTTDSPLAQFAILLPAFLVTELTRAFEIGFLLYLPFLAVDFVVSAILMAMGMQMMSPVVISTPLKLLLFVLVDGWSRLLQGLVLSYATG